MILERFRLCFVFCCLSRIIMHRIASAVKERELIIWGIPQTKRFISHKTFRAAQASIACLSKKYMPASCFCPVLCMDGIRIIDFLRSYQNSMMWLTCLLYEHQGYEVPQVQQHRQVSYYKSVPLKCCLSVALYGTFLACCFHVCFFFFGKFYFLV